MKKIIFFLCIFLSISSQVSALEPPKISVLSPIAPVKMYFNDDTNFRIAEIPPWSLGNHALGGNYLYLVTGYNTHLCSIPDNYFLLTKNTKITNCKLRQTPPINPFISTTDMSVDDAKPLWSRDYYGAFSGHILNTKKAGWQLIMINHGELLNNNNYSFLHQSCHLAPNIGYGTFPCTAAYHEKSYNAFVGMSLFTFTSENFNSDNTFIDQGPVVWPANGYVENGKKATNLGILHPSSIVQDGYIYVFFRDTSAGVTEGRTAGLKVARAPITDSGIDPRSFKTYFQGNFTDNALPVGFSSAQVMDFFSMKGGRSSALFDKANSGGITPDIFSFSAAKISGTNFYLGVAQDLHIGVTLRLSQDLVNWSDQTIVPGTAYDYFGANGGNKNFIKQPFMYPRLANANGDSNNEIHPNDFYIIGTSEAGHPDDPKYPAQIVNQIHLKITLPTTNTSTITTTPALKPTNIPSTTKKSADLNADGKIDIFDYNILVSNFGKTGSVADIDKNGKVDIFDYNQFINSLGSNV
jgi:hypothetical protein